jgi:RND family efflux transporter MFP subunit
MMKMLKAAAWIICLAIFVGGCGADSTETNGGEKGAIPVKTAPVKMMKLAKPVVTSGRLSPQATMKLSFKTGGIIKKIYVNEGDRVKRGARLASLDLEEVQARVGQAENGYDKAARDLKRVENLYKDNAATLEQLQNVRTAFDIAESNRTIARFNLKHSTIAAPSPGRILKQVAEENEMIGPGYPVIIFGSTSTHWVVRCGIGEKDIIRLSLGDGAAVRFDAHPQENFTGTVSEISESIDSASGTYEIELNIKDKGKKLVAGFVARVTISPSRLKEYRVIPIESLIKGEGDRGRVFTVVKNKARAVNVEIAFLFENLVALRSGIDDSALVVTDGSAYLTDGDMVKLTQ